VKTQLNLNQDIVQKLTFS